MKEFKNEYVEQLFDDGLNALYTKFHKYVPFNELVEIFEKGYWIIKENSADKCIVNLQQTLMHDEESTEYVDNVWFPKIRSAGVMVVAFVLPDSVFNRLLINDVRVINGIVMNNFIDEYKAREWIKSISAACVGLQCTVL